MRLLVAASSGQPGGAELALETYLAHLPADVEASGLVLSAGPVAERLAARLGRPVAVASLEGRPGARRAAASQPAPRARAAPGAAGRGLRDRDQGGGAVRGRLPGDRRAAGVAQGRLLPRRVDRARRPLACAGVVPISEAVRETIPAARQLPVVPPPVRLDAGFRVSEPLPGRQRRSPRSAASCPTRGTRT